MSKINILETLAVISETIGMDTKDIVDYIIVVAMPMDDSLTAFVIEQTKFMLFTSKGMANPTEEQLATHVLSSIIGIALNIKGASVAYQYYLDHGLEKYLEMVGKMLYSDEKVG